MNRLEVKDFPYGLMTKPNPTEMPNGSALVSFDCDYNARSISSRKGYRQVLENGPGAVKVADFETGEAWSGGAADTVNFVVTETEADGTQSRTLSALAGTGEQATTLTVALNLGTADRDFFHLWVKTKAMPAGVTGHTLTLRFQTSGGNYYQATLATQASDSLELNIDKYYRIRRDQFTATGAPDWTNITQIRVGLTATGSGLLTVAVDNLHRTSGQFQDLFQFRRQTGLYAGASDAFVIVGGTLYKSNGMRWVPIFTGFDTQAPVYSISAFDRRIMSDGVTTPRVLMSDGSTVYRLGIVTPPKQMAVQVIGGGLPDGDYFYQMLWYSSKTGTFSAPDVRVPNTPITISGMGGAGGIRFTNIPVSTDPQVDWVIIAIRPSTEPELFFRASDGLYGEVANGITTFEYTESYANLVARSLTAVDPDLDYPSVVVDPAVGPVEGHPKFLAEAGGFVMAVMAEKPTVVRLSRFRQPGSWQLDDEFPLGENDQEAISGIIVASSRIIAMKRDAVYPGRVVGGDDRIVFDPPVSDRGATSHKGMAKIGHNLFYRALDGVYVLPPDLLPRKLTHLAQPTWKNVWDSAGIGSEIMIPIRDSEHVVLFGKSLSHQGTNDIGWVTHHRSVEVLQDGDPDDFPEWAPSIWHMPVDVACEVLPSIQDGAAWETWFASRGQVFRIGGYEDDKRAIEFTHRTNLMSPDPARAYLWRFVDIESSCDGTATVDVRCFLGTALIPDASPVANLGGWAAVLGTFTLGTSRLGAQKYVPQRVNLPYTPAKYLSVEIHGRAKHSVEIFKVRPWYNVLGARRSVA